MEPDTRVHHADLRNRGKKITTIEAIGDDGIGKRVQAAWLELACPMRLLNRDRSWPPPRCSSRNRDPPMTHRRRDERQYLPLRHLSTDTRGNQASSIGRMRRHEHRERPR